MGGGYARACTWERAARLGAGSETDLGIRRERNGFAEPTRSSAVGAGTDAANGRCDGVCFETGPPGGGCAAAHPGPRPGQARERASFRSCARAGIAAVVGIGFIPTAYFVFQAVAVMRSTTKVTKRRNAPSRARPTTAS